MDIRRLRYFAVVAELGSFTKAAERLRIAQPALSRQVRQLEEELGLELFSRIGRHIKTTDAGQGLLRHVRTIERDFERLIEDMRSRRETPNGRVILGIPPALADLVPMIISRVQREFPQIAISIVEGISPVLSEWVQSNEVDLAILGLACEGQSQVFPGLKVEVLTTEDMVVIERASETTVRRVYSLEALAAKPLVFSEKFLHILRSGLGPDLKVNIAMSIDSVQAIKAMVLHGSAATILPVSMFSAELREGKVFASALTSSGVRRQLLLAQPSFRQMTQASLKVAQLIKSVIERLKGEGIFSADPFVNYRRKRHVHPIALPAPARLVASD